MSDRLRIPDFYKLSVEERVRVVHERGLINSTDFRALATGKHTLELDAADKMIENVVGVMGLPLGLGMNLMVNDKQYVVPMVVEEPSVVAALGSACKLIRANGGFRAEATDPILIGQIQIVNLPDMERAKRRLRDRRKEIVNLANSFHPNMVARGGGDLGLACALDKGALDAFKASVRERGFRVIELALAERGLTVNELTDESVGERWA